MIDLGVRFLKSMLKVISKKEIRHYLCGLHVKCDGESITVTGSNGHMLVSRTYLYSGQVFDEFIIPVVALQNACNIGSTTLNPIEKTLAGLKFKPIAGKYPNFNRVMTAMVEKQSDHVCFNLHYLSILQSVYEAVKPKQNLRINFGESFGWHKSDDLTMAIGNLGV